MVSETRFCFVAQAGIELEATLVSASQALELQECTVSPGSSSTSVNSSLHFQCVCVFAHVTCAARRQFVAITSLVHLEGPRGCTQVSGSVALALSSELFHQPSSYLDVSNLVFFIGQSTKDYKLC